MTPAVCGALALAALGVGFGLAQWLYTRRLLARLDRMLADAVDGSFRESRFDESRLSALEGRLARFLNGSAASARELEGKRAAIQTLISDISHQTKTPIANILLYASLLAEGELSPEQAAQAATLSRQAEKLSFLIQALVKASRLETGIITTAPEPQPVGPLLEGALAQARPQAEALFNVVDNAVKYTPAGGRVTLSAVPLGQFCRVDVSDTGIGIPEEEQGRIFGRFYRGGAVRAEEGVGIGLYLVREILRRQGGYVKVASRPGQGTTFSLYLPRE
ncbi:sensor histidine kinase KdpD [uncultured Flavonifractor sp.]|uniref:sensor histidine kinase n=1 Tax=uncultured Flavonifractor sp. TaxID=1193534 RepID=UPI0025962A76|nr:HAMP domain-containing sensor histidine kinase [uncultured Flavonifractor sp.]